MERTSRILLLSSGFIGSFAFAITSPVIHKHFIDLIGPDVLALSNLINLVLAAIINMSVSYDTCMDAYRKHFVMIVSIDVVFFTIVSIMCVDYPVIRFIGMSILGAVSTSLWGIILKNSINRLINSDDLTKWCSIENSYHLWGGVFGGIIACLYSSEMIDYIEWCMGIQCFINLIMGIIDTTAYKRLGKQYQDKIAEESEALLS